ncbi:MAG: hypothetical protein HY900_10910 [Deltaproteobacteria bacterium]|nr:hypothetical protein [Deltaproteobacteria bacterium]
MRSVLKRWALPGIVLFAGALFSPALTGTFVWDDAGVQQFQLPAFQSFRDAFVRTSDVFSLSKLYYRPLVWLSYMFDRAVSGGNTSSTVAHGTNLLLHMLATALVFLLGRRLFSGKSGPWAAPAAALLFAAHPIHAESICSVAGRTDILATVCVLGAVLLSLEWREARDRAVLWGLASAGCLFLGLLAKEVAVAGLVLIPLSLWFSEPPAPGRRGPEARVVFGVLLLAAVGAYTALRGAAGVGAGTNLDGVRESPFFLIPVFAHYVRKVVLPWPQHHFVASLPKLWTNAVALTAFLAVALLASKRSQGLRRTGLLAAGWFGVSLLPALAVSFDRTVAPVAERYLYLPSVGFCLLAGAWAFGELRIRRPAALLFGVFLVAYAGSSVERTLVWRDETSLWSSELRSDGTAENGWVLLNLATAYHKKGEGELAERYYIRCMEDAPGSELAAAGANGMANLLAGSAVSLWKNGRPLDAVARLRKAEALLTPAAETSQFPEVQATLGSILLLRAKVEAGGSGTPNRELLTQARALLERALSGNLPSAAARRDLAECLTLMPGSAVVDSRVAGPWPVMAPDREQESRGAAPRTEVPRVFRR